tara:strand:+ start:364 stop:474 length:111 start_codon:yes stop_codon:yes gene_type:complete
MKRLLLALLSFSSPVLAEKDRIYYFLSDLLLLTQEQ